MSGIAETNGELLGPPDITDYRDELKDVFCELAPTFPLTVCEGKSPKTTMGKRWQKKRLTSDKASELIDRARHPAIGVRLGPGGGAIDFDIDGADELVAFNDLFDGEPPVLAAYTSGREGGEHRLAAFDERLANMDAATVDYRTLDGKKITVRLGCKKQTDGSLSGVQSILPCSYHCEGNDDDGYEWSGKQYTWKDRVALDEVGLVKLPDTVIEKLLAAANGNGNRSSHAKAAPIADRVTEGGRNTALASLAGSMRNRGMSEAAIYAGLLVANQEICSPPLPEKEVATIAKSIASYPPAETVTPSDLPQLLIPGGSRTVSQTAGELGVLLAENQMCYMRGGDVSYIQHNKKGELSIRPVKPARLVSDSDRVVQWLKPVKDKPPVAVNLTKTTAEVLLHAQTFQDALPELVMISSCPVLVEENGELVEVVGFHEPSGVYAQGEPTWEMSLEEAISTVCELLDGTKFATEFDESRALSTLIAPALVAGDLLGGRAPIDIYEADDSQGGKSFAVRVKAALYGQVVRSVTQAKQGVKTLEGSLDAAMSDGKQFICFDNIRGKIDIPALESLLTEDSYTTRSAYRGETAVDPRRTCISLTSNSAQVEPDLANRACFVSIRKRPPEFCFRRYPEGDILAHVRANQTKYLSAIFAVVRAWHAGGKPRTRETGHDFRAWCQTLDWIVQNIFKAKPLMGLHKEAQRRVSNPALVWLRNVALAVQRQGRCEDWIQTNELATILADDGYQVEIPGLADGEDLSDDATSKRAWQAMGKRFGTCFRNESRLEIEQFTIDRERIADGGYQPWVYTFTVDGGV